MLTRQEIALKASRASADKARRERFVRYCEEMESAVGVPGAAQELLAAVLRREGWKVTPPGDPAF